MHNLERDLSKDEKCSCGKAASQCSFWRSIFSRVKTENKGAHITLALHLKEHYPNLIFTDNSKTTFRSALQPLRYQRGTVNVLHVIRDGLECLQSNRRHHQSNSLSLTVRTALHYLWSHAVASGLRFYAKSYHRVHYARVAGGDYTQINQLLDALNLPPIKEPRKGHITNCSHQLSGNRLRTHPTISVRARDQYMGNYGFGERIFQAICWPVRNLLDR